MAFRDMDSVCFEARSNWPQRRMDLQGLPDVSLHMLPDRLPSLSEYVQDDFPSPQLKEDFDGNLIVQLDKEYHPPRSAGQDVLPRSCFDVLNSQVSATEIAHSLISTSLATIGVGGGGGGFQSTWPPNLGCIPATSVDHFPASLGTSVSRNLQQGGRNSPFVPTLTDNAATFRELSNSSAHLVSTQNQPFQTTTFPLQGNFRVSPSLGSQPLPSVNRDRFNENTLQLGSTGTGHYGREPWSGLHHQQQQHQQQQQQYPGSLMTSTDRKPMITETAASLPESSMEHSPGSLMKDCSVTWSTGSLISSGPQGWADNHNAKTPPLRKRMAESTTVNPEDADAMKLEMKRAKNREAAQRCQQRKQERIVRLEGKVGKLKDQNVALTQTVRGLREQIAWLQRQVVTHANNGCQLSVPRFFTS